ncbi:MAG TPA: VapE domain-containing protein [Chitinophagaceae bacterium]|jgi:hypothetical protein|nr:VapE domain-containing protein [Chitinophagaceae bacterium]
MTNISQLTVVKKSSADQIKVSLYDSIISKNNRVIDLDEVFRIIKSGEGINKEIEAIRLQANKSIADSLKKQLPAITPSGIFSKTRRLEDLIEYTELICLDFDDVKDIPSHLEKLKRDPWCYAVFISPSGNGLKIFVKVKGDVLTHGLFFSSMSEYFLRTYKLNADKGCKDITRLMFLSHDPNLFVNEFSKVRKLEDNFEQTLETSIKGLGVEDLFVPSNRNNYIYKLASVCCRKGVPKDFTLEALVKKFAQADFPRQEIQSTIKSAYQRGGNSSDVRPSGNQTEGLSNLARVEKYIGDKYDIRFNEVSTKIESRIKGTSDMYKELNENSLSRELTHANINISLPKLASLMLSDFVPSYNPVKEYFEGMVLWDSAKEPDFISKLVTYIPAKDKERFAKHFLKMLVRCVACAINDKVFNKQVFVLVHSMQNSGKSTFCRWLCPPSLSNYITENINTDRDSLIALATNFLINMDELATLSKSDINGLKSFLSKDRINVRLFFGKKTTIMPRRANFLGSTNKDEFLTDETGSVRWLCFELTGMINFDYKKDIDINNVWRQAYTLYLEGFEYQLTPEDIKENERANEGFHLTSMEMQLAQKYYAPSSKAENGIFFTATDILLKLQDRHPGIKLNVQMIGKVMKLLGFEQVSQYLGGETKYSVKGYYTKPIGDDTGDFMI